MSAYSIQLAEMEMLQSMFTPEELRIEVNLVEDFLRHEQKSAQPPISFILNLDKEAKMTLSVTLPADYPAVEPELFVRCENMNKVQLASLNKELQKFIADLDRGEICIYSAVSWLQENAEHFKESQQVSQNAPPAGENVVVRLWIYSHHIYNKDKRKNICSFATRNNCTGFTLPGRPGIICIEGFEEDCEDTWQQIRNMNWKRIVLIRKELCSERQFHYFEEKSFNKSKDERHMDMGEFLKFLTKHNCGYIFKEYFGVDGKLSDEL